MSFWYANTIKNNFYTEEHNKRINYNTDLLRNITLKLQFLQLDNILNMQLKKYTKYD